MTGEVVTAAPIVAPWWRTARVWLVLAGVVALGALLVATVSSEPGRPLDIGSAHKNGSRALARLLEKYGAQVRQTTTLDVALDAPAGTTVVVTSPDDYSAAQLHALVAAPARVVFVRPGPSAARAIAPGLAPVLVVGGLLHPFCTDPGAVAAGPVVWPDNTVRYYPGESGAAPCFDNALLLSPGLAVFGSADVLRNDHLADQGVAALDVNGITDSRQLTAVVWLLPGADAGGSGPVSVWDLFPDGTFRVFWWALVVGALIVIWRARRLGGVVSEPLPVVVKAAELVQGHGRLYARAGARERAGDALRAATTARLVSWLGLPRSATGLDVAAAVAHVVDRPAAEVARVLTGPAPADDAELIRLAQALDELEAAVSGQRKGRE